MLFMLIVSTASASGFMSLQPTYATSTKALLWQLQVDTYTKKKSNYQFNSWSDFNIM